MAFTEASRPGPSRAWRGSFMVFLFGALCYTINMHHEGSSLGPGKGPWGGAFMAFIFSERYVPQLAKVLGNCACLALINYVVADHCAVQDAP